MSSRGFPFIIALLVLLPFASWADSSLGFLYARSEIGIVRNRLPHRLPWLKGPPSNPVVTFDIEVRDAAGVYNQHLPSGQTGWFNLSSPAENRGVMIIFKAPTVLPITRSTEYAPLDIAFVDGEGTIIQIIPNLRLSELDHDIVPEKPVLAFLFMQGGVMKKMSINPGDRVDSSLFKKASLIINPDKSRVPKMETAPATIPPPPLMMPDISPQLHKAPEDTQD